MSIYQSKIETIKNELTMDMLVPHHTGRKPIRCPLPGHNDTHGSFMVYEETNSWWCPSHPTNPCGGSPLDYIMAEKGVDFKEAVRIGADMLHLEIRPPTEEERVESDTRRLREDVLSVVARWAHSKLLEDSPKGREVREHLHGRGFPAELIREQQLGLLNIQTLLQVRASNPILTDFSEADFAAVGLRNERGNTLYLGDRLAIPIRARHCVTSFTFRALDPTEKKHKYMHLPGPAGLYNTDALHYKCDALIVNEGVPDCWTALQFGHQAVACLGVEAAKHAELFRGQKRVVLIWDNDAAGRGRVMKSALAIQAAMPGGEVRILHVPGANDLNDWAQAGGTKEAFQHLLDEAPTLVDTQISALPTTAKSLRDEDLQPVLSTLRLMPELSWDYYVGALANHIQVQPTRIQRLLSQMNRRQPKAKHTSTSPSRVPTGKLSSPYLPKQQNPFRPGLDVTVVDGHPRLNMGMVMQCRLKGDDEDAGEQDYVLSRELLIVTSKPGGLEIQMVPHKPGVRPELDLGGFPDLQFPHWSDDPARPRSLMSFLDDPGMTESGYQLFQDIHGLLADFVHFEDERELDLITIWIMMTYVYPVFYTIGFLHFHGGKGTGKTTILDLIELLSFNSEKSVNPTEAGASFHPHNTSGTSIVDETEHLRNPRPGTREALVLYIYIISYKKGAVQTKGNAETMQSVVRYLFGPKCFGSINGLNFVLGDRCITIRTQLVDADTVHLKDRQHEDAAVRSFAADLRDRLHVWCCTHFGELFAMVSGEMREAHRPRLANRQRELWLPLITIARAIDREEGSGHRLETILLELEALKRSEAQAVEAEENPRLVYLKMLAQLLDDHALDLCASNAAGRHPGMYSLSVLVTEIEKVLHVQRGLPLYVQRDAKWLRNLLVDEHIVDTSKKEQLRVGRDGQPSAREYCYHIDRDVLAAALKRLKLSDQDGQDDGRYLVAPFVAPPGGSSSKGHETMSFCLGEPVPF